MSKLPEIPQSAALACKKCGEQQFTRSGTVRGHQRYHCQACGCHFTDTPPRGYPLEQKVLAVMLYLSGLSMRRTAKLLGVSPPTVMEWIERLAAAYATKPQPTGRAVVIELDEMWHYLKKSPTSSGFGRLTIALQAAWLTGNAAVAIETPPNA
jgi:transposase